MKKTIQLFGLILALATLNSCYTSPDLDGLSSELVVATERDLEVDFKDYGTYYLSDTIYIVTNSIQDDTLMLPPQSTAIISRIEANMNERGYTRTQDHNEVENKTVDIAMAPSIIRVTNTGQSCWGWWGGYPGYWPPWGWWGGYYPYCSYYKYDTGTLLVEIADILNSPGNVRIPTIWTSASFGVLSDYDPTNEQRALRSIDQAFDQSPYIQK